jgi:hypothetical protein
LSFFTRLRRRSTPVPATTASGSDGPVVERRLVVTRGVSALAGLLVFFALVMPNEVGRLTPLAFVRIPVEGVVVTALLLVLPVRTGRVVALLVGAVLGLLTIVKIIDMGFYSTLARPFDLVLDWVLFDDAFAFLTESAGRAGAIGAVVVLVLLAAALVVLLALSVLRLNRLVVRRRVAAARGVRVLGLGWLVCALLGAQFVSGTPIAASSAAHLVYDRARQVRAGVQDQQVFAAEATGDAFQDTPGDQLLTALSGKDVILTFVESYGRDAVENPAIAPGVATVLDDGDRRLAAAGFAARSAFLTSPTFGGGSWLAHATFLSGLWIDNEQRYRNLVSSDRLTLPGAFRRANWRTVGVMPGVTQAWPEGAFYHYDHVYDCQGLDYRGPKFSWAPMPDQYTLATFQRTEYGVPDRGPLMAGIPLVSSHSPWAPIPRLVDWNDVGDGSVYDAIVKEGHSPNDVWRDPAQIRTEYGRSIEYSLSTLISWMETYGDENLVLVFLGDHQPAPIVTGENASRDVPVTIVARDPAMLDRVADWGWDDGLKPSPQAPVWRMDAFRDRFLTAFGSRSGPSVHAGRPLR